VGRRPQIGLGNELLAEPPETGVVTIELAKDALYL